METEYELFNMSMFEVKNVSKNVQVQRIPGGWIYTTASNSYAEASISSVFVPYNIANSYD